MKSILIFTMVLLFITGCSGEFISVDDNRKFSSEQMPPETPKGFVKINNEKTQMVHGNYRWEWTRR